LRKPFRVALAPFALGLFLLPLACGSDSSTGPKDPEDLVFALALGVDLDAMTKTASGLYLQDLVVGTGAEAVSGGSVTVHYTGWYHTGTQFDSSVGGDPVTFDLDGLIAGWQEGIPGMKVGGTRKLVIPPDLAYGDATLVFDIELLGVG